MTTNDPRDPRPPIIPRYEQCASILLQANKSELVYHVYNMLLFKTRNRFTLGDISLLIGGDGKVTVFTGSRYFDLTGYQTVLLTTIYLNPELHHKRDTTKPSPSEIY